MVTEKADEEPEEDFEEIDEASPSDIVEVDDEEPEEILDEAEEATFGSVLFGGSQTQNITIITDPTWWPTETYERPGTKYDVKVTLNSGDTKFTVVPVDSEIDLGVQLHQLEGHL